MNYSIPGEIARSSGGQCDPSVASLASFSSLCSSLIFFPKEKFKEKEDAMPIHRQKDDASRHTLLV